MYFVQTGQDPPGKSERANAVDKHLQDHPTFRRLIETDDEDDSSWQNLVKRLTESKPDERIGHEAIRMHPFLHSLQLPQYKEDLPGAELARNWLLQQSQHRRTD